MHSNGETALNGHTNGHAIAPLLSQSPPSGYEFTRVNGRAYVSHDDAPSGLFELPLDCSADLAALSGVPLGGRGAAWALRIDNIPVVVRAGRRGGLPGRLLDAHYLRRRGLPRPLAELQVSCSARTSGVTTPEILAVAWEPANGLLYQGWVIVREVVRSMPLANLWDHVPPGSSRIAAVRAAAREVARLHNAGVDHHDLNAGNILLTGEAEEFSAWIIDLDRAEKKSAIGIDARARGLWRLWRSLEKHRAAGAPILWTDTARFLQAYKQDATCEWPRLLRALRRTGFFQRSRTKIGDKLGISRPAPPHQVLW